MEVRAPLRDRHQAGVGGVVVSLDADGREFWKLAAADEREVLHVVLQAIVVCRGEHRSRARDIGQARRPADRIAAGPYVRHSLRDRRRHDAPVDRKGRIRAPRAARSGRSPI